MLVGILMTMYVMMAMLRREDLDLVGEVIRLDDVDSVDDWGHGLKFANWKYDGIKKKFDEKWLELLNKVLDPGCNMVDIGANTGDTPLVMAVAARGGTVAAFEMGPPVDMLRINRRSV